jgi:hypothetical protein
MNPMETEIERQPTPPIIPAIIDIAVTSSAETSPAITESVGDIESIIEKQDEKQEVQEMMAVRPFVRHCHSEECNYIEEEYGIASSRLAHVLELSGKTWHVPIVFHVCCDWDTPNTMQDDLDKVVAQLNSYYSLKDLEHRAPHFDKSPDELAKIMGNKTIAADYWSYIHQRAHKVPVVFSKRRAILGKLPNFTGATIRDLDRIIKGSASPSLPAEYGSVLNIWVVRFPPNMELLGISSFPNALQTCPQNDGLIIDMRTTKKQRDGSFRGYDLNATVAHEAGHWLGLLHTFERAERSASVNFAKVDYSGDGSLSPSEITGDCITDTEDQAVATTGNPFKSGRYPVNAFGHLCAFMDVMDYCDDEVNLIFTRDQALKVEWLLKRYRPLIVEEGK